MEYPLDEATTSVTREEKRKLRKGFRGIDMLFYTVTAVIVLNALGAFSANGAQAFTWLVISAVTFFLPYGLLVAELGSTFPQEGVSTGLLRQHSIGSPSHSTLAVHQWWALSLPSSYSGSATQAISSAAAWGLMRLSRW